MKRGEFWRQSTSGKHVLSSKEGVPFPFETRPGHDQFVSALVLKADPRATPDPHFKRRDENH